jgi:hypothetical protein
LVSDKQHGGEKLNGDGRWQLCDTTGAGRKESRIGEMMRWLASGEWMAATYFC